MKTTSLLCCSLMIAAAVVGSGCTTAIKEGIGVARGAKGLYAPIKPLAVDSGSRPLGRYQYFELGQITDDFGGNVPGNLMVHCRAAFTELLAKKKLPSDPAGKTLLIRGKVLHYEDASTLGMALGPLEEVVARIELVDKDSGQVLAVANCIGRTTNRVNIGVPKKGQGLAKAIVDWLDKRYPTAGRIE